MPSLFRALNKQLAQVPGYNLLSSNGIKVKLRLLIQQLDNYCRCRSNYFSLNFLQLHFICYRYVRTNFRYYKRSVACWSYGFNISWKSDSVLVFTKYCLVFKRLKFLLQNYTISSQHTLLITTAIETNIFLQKIGRNSAHQCRKNSHCGLLLLLNPKLTLT